MRKENKNVNTPSDPFYYILSCVRTSFILDKYATVKANIYTCTTNDTIQTLYLVRTRGESKMKKTQKNKLTVSIGAPMWSPLYTFFIIQWQRQQTDKIRSEKERQQKKTRETI